MLLFKWNEYCFQLLWIGPLVTIPYVALQFRRNSDVLKSRAEGSVSRMCADPGCHDPMIWPAELSEWTCIRRTVWFVELAYCACVSHARNPYINSSAVNQREYRTFDVIKSIAIECVRVQPSVHKVSTILSAVMDSPSCRSQSIAPQNNIDHKEVDLHLLSKFGGSSFNRLWVMAWASSKWGKFGFSS